MAKRKPAETQRTLPDNPFPCHTKDCPGVLAPRGRRGQEIDLDREGAAMWVCARRDGSSCGYQVDARGTDEYGANFEGPLDPTVGAPRCPSDGAPLVFDTTKVGTTVGGLRLRGWNYCAHCNTYWLSRKGVPDRGGATADGRWKIANGGRSLDVGGHRLRAEKNGGAENVKQLIARISRMPAFEDALEKIAAGTLDGEAMRKVAQDALAIGEQIEGLEEDAELGS